MTDYFYQNIKEFIHFDGITDDANFHSVPDDWSVIITDVKGSTKAIEEGRYKDVNTVGAASITVIQEAVDGVEFPYVFGGDGATLLIPPSCVKNVTKKLVALKTLSEAQFGLKLRVGLISVKEVFEQGAKIEVAKFNLITGKSVAIFRGGGLTVAEKKIKGEAETYELEASSENKLSLKGLSCRWQPIPSKNGRVLSLLVGARGENESEVYDQVLAQLNEIIDGDIDKGNPVDREQMAYKSVAQCVKDEQRYHDSVWSFGFFARLLEIVFAVAVFKFKVPPLFFNPERYAKSMETHSDYRKFDDMLRMIVDCSTSQINAIREFLEEKYQAGELFYGMFESSTSLMTCYVEDLKDGNHIHFIDGGDGGYAMAAKQLKAQMKDAS